MQSSNPGALLAAGSGEAARTTPDAPGDPARGRGPRAQQQLRDAAPALLRPLGVS